MHRQYKQWLPILGIKLNHTSHSYNSQSEIRNQKYRIYASQRSASYLFYHSAPFLLGLWAMVTRLNKLSYPASPAIVGGFCWQNANWNATVINTITCLSRSWSFHISLSSTHQSTNKMFHVYSQCDLLYNTYRVKRHTYIVGLVDKPWAKSLNYWLFLPFIN